MRKIQGNKIELLETPNAPRDIFAAGQVLGFVEEVEAVMDAAINFWRSMGNDSGSGLGLMLDIRDEDWHS
jgi:hypothetical protein